METRVISFRPWKEEDYLSLTFHINNKNIWDNMRDYLPYPYTENDAKKFIEYSMNTHEAINYAIDMDGEAIGGIGIIPGKDVERVSAEIGYWLSEKFWNQGITTKIVSVFSDQVLESGKYLNLFAGVFDHNPASMAVLIKAGFRPAGILHRKAIKNGIVADMHYFEKTLK